MKRIFKKLIENLAFLIALKKYKVPSSCKIWPSRKVNEIYCEGYNTISRNTEVYNAYIGYASGISRNSVFHNVKIGKYSVMAPGIQIIRGQHPTKDIVSVHPSFYSIQKQYGFTYVNQQKYEEFKYADEEKKYSVIIGNDVWIASNVTILEGIKIGDGAIIAASSVVTKDVPPYSIYGGNPAKLIRYRFNDEDLNFLLNLKWWQKESDWIKNHAKYFCDIKSLKKNINGTGTQKI